jgi:hypothetical protein
VSDYGRRLIVDRSCDLTLWVVVDSFIREGFTVTATDVRRAVRRIAEQDLRRYVLLHATHGDLTWQALKCDLDIGVLMTCQIAVYEMPDGRTGISVGDLMGPTSQSRAWQANHPTLAAIGRSLEEHVARALDAVVNGRIHPPVAA